MTAAAQIGGGIVGSVFPYLVSLRNWSSAGLRYSLSLRAAAVVHPTVVYDNVARCHSARLQIDRNAWHAADGIDEYDLSAFMPFVCKRGKQQLNVAAAPAEACERTEPCRRRQQGV